MVTNCEIIEIGISNYCKPSCGSITNCQYELFIWYAELRRTGMDFDVAYRREWFNFNNTSRLCARKKCFNNRWIVKKNDWKSLRKRWYPNRTSHRGSVYWRFPWWQSIEILFYFPPVDQNSYRHIWSDRSGWLSVVSKVHRCDIVIEWFAGIHIRSSRWFVDSVLRSSHNDLGLESSQGVGIENSSPTHSIISLVFSPISDWLLC